MTEKEVPCRFSLGEIVKHRQMGFRGVIVEIDDQFRGDEAAYQELQGSKPPKAQPWYHVLIDGEDEMTYIPELSLEVDSSSDPIINSLIADIFSRFENGRYMRPLH